jgi:NTP pyrophosphatase (non-canonical NTP hydrolase)
VKDLEQKHKALTLALAAKSADAYEAWVAFNRPSDSTPTVRKEVRAKYERLENEIGDLVKERDLVARALNYELEASISDKMQEASEKLREMQQRFDEELERHQPEFDHSVAEANGGVYPQPTPEQEAAIADAFPEAGMEVGTPVSGNGEATDVVLVRGRRTRTPKH